MAAIAELAPSDLFAPRSFTSTTNVDRIVGRSRAAGSG
jgi:hypothetical protein